MSRSADRELIAALLIDESLSYREVARLAGCSDWTVRRIAREQSGDARPMKREGRGANPLADDPSGLSIVSILFGTLLFAGLIWLGVHRRPPTDFRHTS